MLKFLILILLFYYPESGFSKVTSKKQLTLQQSKIIDAAARLLEEHEVSYAYGGAVLGSAETCEACNKCIEDKAPKPTQQLKHCPVCKDCSLDCSHLVERIYKEADLGFPYLTTNQMIRSSALVLKETYRLVEVDFPRHPLREGDMLVFEGHVVLIEKVRPQGKVDIIHATSGKDLKGAGYGIQRQRYVLPLNFRGPLKRVLRHVEVQ